MGEFMFATGIECSYPTIDGGRWRLDQLEMTGHYRHWRRDLELVRELGLRYLRYGPPLHRIYLAPTKYDWSFMDEVAERMQELGITPITNLCYFGLPDWLENFQNPELPERLAEYATAFAGRYPWMKFYTPVNEMYVTARMSALDGVWNEQLRTDRAFVTATRHVAKASALMMQASPASGPKRSSSTARAASSIKPAAPTRRFGASRISRINAASSPSICFTACRCAPTFTPTCWTTV
jgi:beta-glucosidase/6-phospho-beta-glucosidase/beta-galactosidase